MTSCVPHWDSVFLHFQSVKPWRSLIMKGLSLFQRTASRLIWLRYVCQDGGTVSKAYIFYEHSLIWLNNLTIPPMKVSSPPQLMWLSLCLNKITQMDYAIFVLPWFSFFFIINSCLPYFPDVLYICCRGGGAFPSILGRSDNHVGKADSALCIVWNHRSQGGFLECWGWPGKSILAKSKINISEKWRLRQSFLFHSNLVQGASPFCLWRAAELPNFPKVISNTEHLH